MIGQRTCDKPGDNKRVAIGLKNKIIGAYKGSVAIQATQLLLQ